MGWFTSVIVRHKGTIVLALLMAIIVAAPQVAFRFEHRDDGVYQGIELLPDNSWPPRVREIMDGHGFGSIYYKDGKNDPYIFQPLGSMTVAYLGEVFGLDINNTLLLARFVLSFIAFLLVYSFVFLLSRDKLIALATTSLLLLADAVMNFSGLMQLIHGISPSNFLNIGLPVNPAMILIPLFGFLVLFWLFYTKKDWRLGVFSAIFLGLNFYNYFYSWTYLYAFGGILVLLFLFKKDWREAARIASVFFGALIVAIPYGINLYRASQYPTFADVGMRLGMVLTHTPLFVGSVAIIALGIFLAGFPKEDSKRYLFGLALLLAPFITMNQQIFTGKEMQVAHYHWYFHKPMAILFISLAAFFLLSRFRKGWYKKVFAALIITASFATGLFVQADSYVSNSGDGGSVAVERQQYGPVMQWLNEHAAKEDVVLANDPISYLVTIYTPLNVLYHRAALYALSATEGRLQDTLFILYRLRGISTADASQVFFAERGFISTYLYGIYYRQLLGSYDAIPDDKTKEILDEYRVTLTTPASVWLAQKLSQYEVNYVIWDKRENPDWQAQKYPFLHEVDFFGDITIYRFQP